MRSIIQPQARKAVVFCSPATGTWRRPGALADIRDLYHLTAACSASCSHLEVLCDLHLFVTVGKSWFVMCVSPGGDVYPGELSPQECWPSPHTRGSTISMGWSPTATGSPRRSLRLSSKSSLWRLCGLGLQTKDSTVMGVCNSHISAASWWCPLLPLALPGGPDGAVD